MLIMGNLVWGIYVQLFFKSKTVLKNKVYLKKKKKTTILLKILQWFLIPLTSGAPWW